MIKGHRSTRATAGALAAGLAMLGSSSAGAATPQTRAQLRAELLSTAELPAGWTLDSTSSSGSTSVCGVTKVLRPKVKADVAFSYAGKLPELGEGLATVPNGSQAFARANHALGTCSTITIHNGGETLHGRLARLQFPALAPHSAAYAATFSVQGQTLTLDLVVAAKPHSMFLLDYADIGPTNTATLQHYATQALAKVQG